MLAAVCAGPRATEPTALRIRPSQLNRLLTVWSRCCLLPYLHLPATLRLWIELGILQPPLPDVAPGALPELHTLHITVHTQKQPFVLPSSWGAQPSVLPALRRLHLELPVAPPLPPVWARGFRQLESLNFMQVGGLAGGSAACPARVLTRQPAVS